MIPAVLCWVLLAPVTAISAVFVVEMVAGLLRARATGPAAERPADIVVVIPAHDEAAGIAATVAALSADLSAGARLLVVADNCRDATADLARAAGAEAIERRDPLRPGKGYALAFARDHLVADHPDIVIVIDADCRITDGGIAALAAAAMAAGRPVQAAYLLNPRLSAGPMVQLSGFAFLVRNLVRQRGLARIGAPALLTGSGMAFPWPIFAAAPLATADIVEDLALGIALAERGQAPAFMPEVTIWSDPASADGTREQRRRWEHGFLATARARALPLILSGRGKLMWLGAHLLVPPLALLAAMHLALLAILALSASAAPLAIEAGMLTLMALLVGLAWFREGRAQMRASAWLRVPLYLLWKAPLHLARRERRWIRTERP